ncbi:hypothetical protein GOV13_04625 [Candidatus Pacearchaeota archaeon]|nr:hypothetical protein [Candidatus Pacearchaeota archaeon]
MEEHINQNESEEKDVEVFEFSLDDREIEELILKLQLLRVTKEPFGFEVDEENELLINYEEGEEEGE